MFACTEILQQLQSAGGRASQPSFPGLTWERENERTNLGTRERENEKTRFLGRRAAIAIPALRQRNRVWMKNFALELEIYTETRFPGSSWVSPVCDSKGSGAAASTPTQFLTMLLEAKLRYKGS